MVRVCSPGGRVAVVDVFTSSPEQAEAFNRMEKLRDPSHVRALSLEELTGLFGEASLQNVRRQFYKHEFGLEPVLKGSFPNPGDAERIRRLFEDDLGLDRLGLGVHRRDGNIHFAYPIVILVGHNPPMTFGKPLEGVAYTERPAAYAVVTGENGTVAAVRGTTGMIGLPGGGSLPGDTPEETVRREVREELARNVRLVGRIGEATQFFYAADEDRHYKMQAVFFLAEFTDEPSGQGEHEPFLVAFGRGSRSVLPRVPMHGQPVKRAGEKRTTGRSMNPVIRPETTADLHAIRQVNRLAFGQEDEARLVDALRDGVYVRVSLVAEQAGQIVGHILFSDLPIFTEARAVPALALAPDGGAAGVPERKEHRLGRCAQGLGPMPAAGTQDRRRPGPPAILSTVRVFLEAG